MSMSNKKISNILILFLSLIATGGCAMGITDVGRVCLFSAISGTITLDGKPVVNATLIRTADRDGPKSDEAVTDENGWFEFPPMYEHTVTKYLPMEFVASQQIIVNYQGKSYEIWDSVKRKPQENSESKGNVLRVACELNGELRSVLVDRVPIHTLCNWDVEIDKPIDWENI